jgi:hypothetical protein
MNTLHRLKIQQLQLQYQNKHPAQYENTTILLLNIISGIYVRLEAFRILRTWTVYLLFYIFLKII